MIPDGPLPLSWGVGRFTLGAVYVVHLQRPPRAMPTYYYGTIPVLAWILNHYFYGGVHYAWLAKEFFPPKPNPSSSNPHHIYGEFKDAWNDRDGWNYYVETSRDRLDKGVVAQHSAGVVSDAVAARLQHVCETVSVDLFYPVVYRVEIERMDPRRMVIAHSGCSGSREVLIPNLLDHEFDLLFADNAGDLLFRTLVLDEIAATRRTSLGDALLMLEARCKA